MVITCITVNQVLLVCVTRVRKLFKVNAVFCVHVKAFKTSEATLILENIDPKENTTRLPPVKPKAGEVYLYLNDDESKSGTYMYG